MKIYEDCGACGNHKLIETKCDTCGKSTLNGEYVPIPITISFGYGDNLDGEEYDFCSKYCAVRFLLNEMKKEGVENNNQYEEKEDEKMD